MKKHVCIPTNRREFLRDSFCGFGSLALASLLQQEEARAAVTNPLASRPPHLPVARARSVIFLFMSGGPSHLGTFDPKPLLTRLNGQPRPAQFGDAKYQIVSKDAKLLASKRSFK